MTKANHDAMPGRLERCQICGSKKLFEAIDLGHQPLCGALLTDKTINYPEIYYPLKLMLCPQSGLGQLGYVIDGRVVYPPEYLYRPGISKPLRSYLESFAGEIVPRFKIPPQSLCVDIGCSDGTLLTGFKRLGMRALGVEPTNMAKFARRKNRIETIQDFFTETTAKKIVKKYGRAKTVTMTNVFAHMAALGEVMKGLIRLLDKDGVFITESQYLLDVLERNQFDEIYHDHIRIYSLKSIVKLLSYYGMEVFDAKRISSREGSIRVYAGWKQGGRPITPEVGRLLKLEEEKGLFKPEAWARFRARINENRKKMLNFVFTAKRKGLRFAADSCPTRGVVLVNYFGLGRALLPYIAQLPKSEKIGKYLPGTHTPIVSNEILLKEKPDYVVILAWHYADYIMKNWRAKGLKSKFVIPLPKFKIINQ